MIDHGHRTFVGTLVFLDVLDPRPDALELVQEAAARAVGHLESDDVLSVPHPRGLVLVFPGDPEDGLFVALGLRDALEHEASNRTGFGARMAIHLGPVRIIEGVAQGEGPTVGAHLASLATAGQILSSRSFFEVVSSLSAEHRALLHPLGRRRTAEGKELDVYELGSHVEREVEMTWPAARTPAPGVQAAPPVQPIPLVTPVEAPPPPAPAPAPAPVIVTGGWVAGALEELGAVLARSIGPLAHTLVRRAARVTQDPRALVAELAESIENGDDRRKFEDFARSWIRRSRAVGGTPATPGPPYTPGAPYTPGPPATPGPPLTPQPQHAPSRAMAAPARGGGSAGLTAEQRAMLEAALAPHLGPIARVMVDRVARDAPDWGTACQTLSGSIPDNVSREDFLRTLSDPGHLRTRTQARASGKTATQARPAATQARPGATQARPAVAPPAPARGSPSRPTPVVEQPPSPMPRGSPSRPVPVQPGPPPRGSPSRPTPVVEPPRARGVMEDDLHRAEQALAVSLGPVARTLVKRAARNANTPWELFASLATELPEGPERERFLAAQPEY